MADFNVSNDFFSTQIKYRIEYYLLNGYTGYADVWQAILNDYMDSGIYRVRVNTSDTIDYAMTLSPPEGFEGTTLQVTTSLTYKDDYQMARVRYVAGQGLEYYTEYHEAGDLLIEQTQEVVLGDDNTISFSYDPPYDLARSVGFYGELSVTVTEPISRQSYTTTYDKSLYLYRCPYGKVTNAKTGQPIAGTRITVHFEDGSIVPLDKASNPTATNPQYTDATGRYGAKLQTNRKYYITAKAEGYKPYKSEIFTEKWHVLREDVALTPIDQVASR
jgi:hypothetical protein